MTVGKDYQFSGRGLLDDDSCHIASERNRAGAAQKQELAHRNQGMRESYTA
jgi:hypothetical protein